jgi:hypothetical protein
VVATERDEQKRSAFRQRLKGVDPKRLLFVDESSTNVALIPRYGRAPKGERALGWCSTEELGQERHTHLLDRALGDGTIDEHRGTV